MCLLKISIDYIDAEKRVKRNFLMTCSILFMLIGAFLFGLVTVQSIEDDIGGKQAVPLNQSVCL